MSLHLEIFFIRIWIIPSSSESFNNRESDQLEISTKNAVFVYQLSDTQNKSVVMKEK